METRLYHPALDSHPEQQYLDMLRDLMNKRSNRETRNDGETVSLFGRQIRFDMKDGFPLLTTKKLHWHSIITELLWFLRGETNISYLKEHGVTIWDKWADKEGNLGPVYGYQWRKIGGDQIATVIQGIMSQPTSRRHIVDSWNAEQVNDMALPPCHCLFQFYVGDDDRLSLGLYQRSADMFLGVPFNIASYAALLHIVAGMTGYEPGELIHTFGDYHVYGNHREQVQTQLARGPRQFPQLKINRDLSVMNIEDVTSLDPSDFVIEDYNPYPTIKAEVSA